MLRLCVKKIKPRLKESFSFAFSAPREAIEPRGIIFFRFSYSPFTIHYSPFTIHYRITWKAATLSDILALAASADMSGAFQFKLCFPEGAACF
jgi:hypothetical protein